MGKRVTVAGYYGFGNVGDEAVLTAMLRDIRQLCPAVDFVVLSEDPQRTSSLYDVQSVCWRDLKAVLTAIEESDMLIVGGGGLYNSYLDYVPEELLSPGSSSFSVFVFGLPLLAAFLGKICMIYAVGASYVNSDSAKKHICLSLETAALVTVRDDGSKSVFESLGYQVERVQVTSDPAFGLVNASSERVKDILAAEGILLTRPVVAVVMRNWAFCANPERWEREVAGALTQFAEEQNASVLFLPFQRSSDTPFDLSNDASVIGRIKGQMGLTTNVYVLSGTYSSAEISAILANCDLVLGMRLHSVILAIKNAVPFVALSYEPKVSNVLRMAGLEDYGLELSSLTGDTLGRALRAAYEDHEGIRARLSQAAAELRQRAFENAHLAARLLYDGVPVIHRLFESELGVFLQQFSLKQTELLLQEREKTTLLQTDVLSFSRAVRSLVDNQQFAAALALTEHLLSEHPTHSEWNYLAAFSLHMQGRDMEKALRHYCLALDEGFDEFWVRYNRGVLFTSLGDLPQARADLERAVDLNPGHDGARAACQAVRRTMALRPAELQAQVEGYQAQVGGLQTQVGGLQTQVRDLQGQVGDLQAQLADRESMILSLQQEKSRLADRLQALESLLAGREDTIASLTSQLTSIYESRSWRLVARIETSLRKARGIPISVTSIFDRGRLP